MSAGSNHSAAVTECGKLYTWGHNPDGRLLLPVRKILGSKKPICVYYPKQAEVKIRD